MGIIIRSELHDYFTTQYAGDMQVRFDSLNFTLLQIWSEEDFIRLQENMIGHLVTQKTIEALTPTLFIGTTASENDIISVCNLSGEVILETFGQKKRGSALQIICITIFNKINPCF